ncbi:hypothetical protein D9M70_500730 [compost metagenome]
MHQLRAEHVERNVRAGDVGHHAVVQHDGALAAHAGRGGETADQTEGGGRRELLQVGQIMCADGLLDRLGL